jgi:hypothetical protein
LATPPGAAVTPTCCLAHDLLNKLTAIIAECELLQIEAPAAATVSRAHNIRDLAGQIAQRVVRHQCTLDEVLRSYIHRP